MMLKHSLILIAWYVFVSVSSLSFHVWAGNGPSVSRRHR